jgi:methylmalonyl-CoA/ethylmalonyl-CoA epimerase
MSIRIDHIGIAVQTLGGEKSLFGDVLGLSAGPSEEVASEHVRAVKYRIGESDLEFLEPTSESGAIAKHLGKRGPGIHHLSLAVDDLDAYIAKVRAAGIPTTTPEPFIGAGGHRVIFLHPKATGGILIELAEHK